MIHKEIIGGSNAHIMQEGGGYKAVCGALECVVLPPVWNHYFTSYAESVKKWNTRKPDEAIRIPDGFLERMKTTQKPYILAMGVYL